jgi:hypothetical protein
MVAEGLTETPALLLMHELWQYLTHGWVHFSYAQGADFDTDDVAGYWIGMATHTIAANDTPGFDS